jgi:putative ABC transport system substrate-binding protein
MRRRDFMALFGGAAAAPLAWPLTTLAQQPAKETAMPVIGFLSLTSPDGYAVRLGEFRRGLKETGYVEGENVAIEYRWAEGQYDRLPAMAAELVRRRVTAIAAFSGSAFPAKAATTTIPIVFLMAEDPVRRGLVVSLARPGGNLTGVNFVSAELVAKRLELLRELVPAAARVAVLINPGGHEAEATLRDVETAARALGLQIQIFNAKTSGEIDAAYASLMRERPDAVFVANNPFFNSRRLQLSLQAMRHAVPATYSGREYAELGGLMSYGSNLADAFRQVGVYVGRVLKGGKPADMPVVQASKFELVINAQTARVLGLTVPPSLLSRADEVIE